jgi:hypothetical protein
MLYKIRTFAIGEEVVEKSLPKSTKWTDILLDVNATGEKVGLEPISLSKLCAIKKTNFSKYITKRQGDKFSQCSNCKKLKRLRNAHTMGTESYEAHNLNYFKHVNMQEAHHNEYYMNRVLSISKLYRCLWSSMTKWTTPKQPHYVLQVKSNPHTVFISYMYWSHVNFKKIALHYLNTTLGLWGCSWGHRCTPYEFLINEY